MTVQYVYKPSGYVTFPDGVESPLGRVTLLEFQWVRDEENSSSDFHEGDSYPLFVCQAFGDEDEVGAECVDSLHACDFGPDFDPADRFSDYRAECELQLLNGILADWGYAQ